MAEADAEPTHSISAYLHLLRSQPGWRILWIGEILSNMGNWLSYIATLLVVEQLAHGKGIYLSIVLVIHFLPAFILFPMAGVVADRLLYVLLWFEFSTSAFYDPARRALTPNLVPKEMLHLATTLDAFAWSFTAAFGASLGGLAASRIGVYACFTMDAFTYVLSTLCALRLRAIMAEEKNRAAAGDVEITDLTASSPSKGSKLSGSSQKLPSDSIHLEIDEDNLESSALLGTAPDVTVMGSNLADMERREGAAEEAPTGCLPLLLWSVKDEIGDMKEGFRYAHHVENRDVLAMSLLKASGAIVWGAADVLNVRFSGLPEMQSWGNQAFTLGLFFGSVGVGCVLGPILFNYFTPPKPKRLLLSCTVCNLFLWTGYIGMAVAQHILPMCLSIVWKSFGSAVVWMYSTLLLQMRVPDHLLGRMLALEMAAFTVAESISGLFGGVALDDLGWNIRQISGVLAGLGCVIWIMWSTYCTKIWRRTSKDSPSERFFSEIK